MPQTVSPETMNEDTEAIVRELMQAARETKGTDKEELVNNLAVVKVYYLIRQWHAYLNKVGVAALPHGNGD